MFRRILQSVRMAARSPVSMNMFSFGKKAIVLSSLLCCGVFFASVCLAETSATLGDFWDSRAQLGEPELVSFVGNPASHDLWPSNLRALVNVDSQTIYGYFAQLTAPSVFSYEIYMVISTDGGKTFNVQPNPIIQIQDLSNPGYLVGRLTNAYDPDVIKLSDGYYMVFEGIVQSSGCTFSTFIAYSSDGVHNWQVKGVPVCSTDWDHSASTPNFVQDAMNGSLYLQWVNVDNLLKIVTHHQIKMDRADLFKTLTNDVSYGQLPQGPVGSWDERNFGSGNVIYENGYYYLFFDGSPGYGCGGGGGRWGVGMARTNNIADVHSWIKSTDNPFLRSTLDTSCWLQYPEIIKIGNDHYLYYQDSFPYWAPFPGSRKNIFRVKIQLKPQERSAKYVAQTVPSSVRPSQPYQVSVTMKNTGANSWTEGDKYRLGSQNPTDGTTWGFDRVRLASSETINGLNKNCSYFRSLGGGIKSEPAMASIESRYIVVATGLNDWIYTKEWRPDLNTGEVQVLQDWYQTSMQTSGQFKLVLDHGTLWLYVKNTAGNVYRAYYRSHGSGEVSNWSSPEDLGNVDLESSGPQTVYSYKAYNASNSVALAKCLPDGDTKTFTFNVTAPSTPGVYNFQWQMLQEGVVSFGDITPNVAVTVSPPCNTITTSNFSQNAYNAYGAPFDAFAMGTMLINAQCTSTDPHTIQLTSGVPSDTTRIVYIKGYYYTGSAWNQYTGTCAGNLNGDWCQGSVSAMITDPSLSTASVANPTYLVGMTCSVQDGEWKCGCRDTSCTNFYWQVQGAGM